MSKKFIKNLEDGELDCYICRKKIRNLDKLRDFFNDRIDLTRAESRDLRDDVGLHVVPVVVNEEKKKVFRHDRCNPKRFKPRVEDL